MDILDTILSIEEGSMEQLIWETVEELDKKLAMRVRNIRKFLLLHAWYDIYKIDTTTCIICLFLHGHI